MEQGNWLYDQFGPDLNTLDLDPPRYGDPGRPRSELHPERYDPIDPDGSLQRTLEVNAGPDPLGTVDVWKNDVNPHHSSRDTAGQPTCVEAGWNCAAVMRAGADLLQGLGVRLADLDFRREVALDPHGKAQDWSAPGDYEHTYEWMGVRGPGYRLDWNLPPNHPDPQAHANAFTRKAYDSVEAGLRGRPPGTVAAVCVGWANGGGHWFLGYVDRNGQVRALDLQPSPNAIHRPWPYLYPSPLSRLEFTIREPGGDWEGPPPSTPLSTWP